jgi:hypothetical protein
MNDDIQKYPHMLYLNGDVTTDDWVIAEDESAERDYLKQGYVSLIYPIGELPKKVRTRKAADPATPATDSERDDA